MTEILTPVIKRALKMLLTKKPPADADAAPTDKDAEKAEKKAAKEAQQVVRTGCGLARLGLRVPPAHDVLLNAVPLSLSHAWSKVAISVYHTSMSQFDYYARNTVKVVGTLSGIIWFLYHETLSDAKRCACNSD